MGAHPDVNYFYFGRNIWRKHRGVVTVGVLPDYEAGKAKVAFAYCSIKDTFRRFNEPDTMPRRKRVQDPSDPKRGHTETEMVPNPAPAAGGADIVNARLGLVENAKVPVKFVELDLIKLKAKAGSPADGAFSLLHTAMAAFNEHVPVAERPRLWKNRRLVYWSRFHVAMEAAGGYGEALAATGALWTRRDELVPGFVTVGRRPR